MGRTARRRRHREIAIGFVANSSLTEGVCACPVVRASASFARRFSRVSSDVEIVYSYNGMLHVWEAERRDRWFGRASRELGVPLTAARGIATSAHPDSCTRALCAGAGIQVRRQTGNALERGRYTGFANRLPGAGMAGAR